MEKRITEHEFEQLCDEMIIDYLKTATSQQRCQMVQEWKYDNTDGVLAFIADDPPTDKDTMLMMYWMMGPRWFMQYASREEVAEKASWSLDDYDFINLIESRYLNGYYTTQQIAYDPKDDKYSIGYYTYEIPEDYDPERDRGFDWTAEYMDKVLVADLPKEMDQALQGERIFFERGWLDGVPPHIDDKINELRLLIAEE